MKKSTRATISFSDEHREQSSSLVLMPRTKPRIRLDLLMILPERRIAAEVSSKYQIVFHYDADHLGAFYWRFRRSVHNCGFPWIRKSPVGTSTKSFHHPRTPGL